MVSFYLLKIQNQLNLRITKLILVVCANATCCHKLSLMLIGKYNKPAYFANRICSLKHAAQKCALMDISTCWNWFNEVFCPDVCRRTCHQALLLMNNTPGYFDPFQRENVVERFFLLLI